MSEYTAKDIVSLSAGRAFRDKLGMYLTGEKQEAINLGLRELIVNVQDEYEVYQPANPYCKIELDTKTRIIKCSDNARGIPVGERDDGMNSLTAAFLIPHSGGKHTEGAYSSAIGINGEGNKIVCHTATWLEVEVKRDGNIYKQRFESTDEGATAVTDVEIIGKTQETGTTITYVADPKVYGDIYIDIDKLREMLKNMSLFSKGLKFILIIDGKEEIYYSENGLIDGLSNSNALSKPFSYYYETPDCKLELALQWVSKGGEIRGYANSLYVKDGGRFITGFKTSLTRTFNSLAKAKFDGDRIRNLLDGFVSVKVKVGQWSNQQKTSLANPEAGTATSTAISNCLKEFAAARPDDFNKVVTLLEKLEKAEKAADKARNAVMTAEKEMENKIKKRAILSAKLKDCKIHGSDAGSILAITEGDSALGALAQARPVDTVALIPVLGKIISALKHPTEDILKNEEVKAIFAALGCGFFDKYNEKKLRYQYVAIATDGDKDGDSISCLIITLFYFMCPDFLKQGRLIRMKMPLDVLEYKTGRRYAFSTQEREDIIAKYGKPISIGHKKGIGENTPDETAESVFGEQRHWEQYIINDYKDFQDLIQMLMGKEVKDRRDYIMKNVDFSRITE